jgi:hypothetical protein
MAEEKPTVKAPAKDGLQDGPKRPRFVDLVRGGLPLTQRTAPDNSVLVWPNLIYVEFIALLIATVVLLFLSLVSPAPLEEMASASTTPNPTKAPWYFLGLQELLVYFDPWLAGVVLPGMIIIGLILIPFMDPNSRGKGYYSYSERKFAVLGFLFGLALWYVLIVVGVWFRGLDWQWYWPWDNHEIHKPASAVKLIDLEVILQNMLQMGDDPTPLIKIGSVGITLPNLLTWMFFLGYYAVGFTIPFLFMRSFYTRLGFARYNLVMFLFLSMMGVPLKIFLRLLANIKYVLVTPWFKI